MCFDYEKNRDAIQEDAIITCKGKFEVSDRGKQILVYEAKPLVLTEEDANTAPLQLELALTTRELNALVSDRLMRILQQYPGRDPVILNVSQVDGRRMRAELPLTVDSGNSSLRSRLYDLFGRTLWKAS